MIFVHGICQIIHDKDHLEISNHLIADSDMSAVGNAVCIINKSSQWIIDMCKEDWLINPGFSIDNWIENCVHTLCNNYICVYWEPTLTRGYWFCIGSWPSRGATDSVLGADPHEGLLTLYWELTLTRGYWFCIGSCPSRGVTDSILGADPHEGLLTLYWELTLMRGYWLYIGSCPSWGADNTSSVSGLSSYRKVL